MLILTSFLYKQKVEDRSDYHKVVEAPKILYYKSKQMVHMDINLQNDA